MRTSVRFMGIAVIGLAVASVTAAPALAQSAVWNVTLSSYPTNLVPGSVAKFGAPGPGYLVTASNVGAGPTNGAFKIVDSLPNGVAPSPLLAAEGHAGPPGAGSGEELDCTLAGQTIICEGQATLFPGEELAVKIPVAVDAAAPASVINEATIEGGAAAPASSTAPTTISTTLPSFSFLEGPAGASGSATDEDGAAKTQAGSHPYRLGIAMQVGVIPPVAGEEGLPIRAPGDVRSLSGELPAGVVIDPQAVATCSEEELTSNTCPANSQVGTVNTAVALAGSPGAFFSPLYNMEAPPGLPALLSFEAIEGTYVGLRGGVDSSGYYQLKASARNVPAKIGILGATLTLWGDPTDSSHDHVRSKCASRGGECISQRRHTAFVTLPSRCTGDPISTTLDAESWLGVQSERTYPSTDLRGKPVGITGCGALAFEPEISAKTTTAQAESPSGLEFDLHQPQHEGYEELATAALKNISVTLPEGLILNASAANGREACSSVAVGLATPIGRTPIHFTEAPEGCPDSSRVGTAEVITPLLAHPLKGSVYLAKPFDNPFDSLLAIYLVVEDEATGIVAKLAGNVVPDQSTGQLTTTFSDSPQLPLEDVRLRLFDGSRAALTSPLTCGLKSTSSTLVPWSTPEGVDVHPTDSFDISANCATSEGAASKSVSFSAGTVSPLAGAYTPFVLRISRPDGSQHITGIETTLPAGLLGKLAGVSYCSESGIAQARSREDTDKGRLERESPSCPASSEVGSVLVTAGSGEAPVPVSGHAYLAGPYKGAPLSLVVIVPAVAGPFDLGTVVDRIALNVGEYDARIHAVADPLPTIRDGIPLDVRSIELKLDRPGFTLNPTSCEAMAIVGSASTQPGQQVALNNRFQVGECGHLAFKPRIAISLKGGTKRAAHPALRAVVTYPKHGNYTNIARAQVALPHSEFLDQGNIGKACTKPVLQARACPTKSIYGKVKAWTPLLGEPLQGPVYLVGGYGYKLPALVAELSGQIKVLLVGKIDSDKQNGIRNTFEAVPDAPIERFVLEMKGGKKYGLLVNSENICKKRQIAGVSFRAQSGKSLTVKSRIANSCGKVVRKGKAR